MVFYIKAVGDWTKKLRSEVLRRINGDTNNSIEVLVRGPFGAPAQHADGYDRIVLISGGIGATPFVSVCKHVYFQMKSRRMGATLLGYAKDYDDGGKDDKEEAEEVSSEVAAAFKRLSESINTVIRGGGEVTDTDSWNYAQSASKLPLASPRASHPRGLDRSKSDAVLTNVTTGNQVTGVTKISTTNQQQQAAETPATPEKGDQATTETTTTATATATATGTPSFMSHRAGSTPRANNKRISDATWGTTVTTSSTTTTPTSQVPAAPSPPAATQCETKSDDTPAASTQQKAPKSMDVIGRSFGTLVDQQHQQGEDKTPTTTTTPTASTTPSTTSPTTPTSTRRDPMHSFAAKTMQIDDARTAQMVRNRAEMKIHVRTNRFFHSVSVSMLLCVMLILRLVLIALMDIFHVTNDRIMPGRGDAMAWMTAVDVTLGVFIAGGLCISLALDAVTSSQAFFTDCGRIIDLFVLVPVAIASNFTGVYVLVYGGEAASKLVEQLHFAVLVGGTTLLMMYRLARIIGSRISLADRYTDSHFGKLTAMDFLWTTPNDDNDEWIRDELQPFANGTDLRLHRYVTRMDREDPETGVQPVVSREMITNYG